MNEIENTVNRLSSKLDADVCKISELEAVFGESPRMQHRERKERKQSLVSG